MHIDSAEFFVCKGVKGRRSQNEGLNVGGASGSQKDSRMFEAADNIPLLNTDCAAVCGVREQNYANFVVMLKSALNDGVSKDCGGLVMRGPRGSNKR